MMVTRCRTSNSETAGCEKEDRRLPEEYNKDKGYAFVFRSVDLMYLKDSSYNITRDV